MGIISNWDHSARGLLAAHGLTGFFDPIVISSEVGCEKPSERIFRIALEKAGVPAERCLYVGDNYYDDAVGCRKVGMRPLILNPYGRLGIEEIEDCPLIPSWARCCSTWRAEQARAGPRQVPARPPLAALPVEIRRVDPRPVQEPAQQRGPPRPEALRRQVRVLPADPPFVNPVAAGPAPQDRQVDVPNQGLVPGRGEPPGGMPGGQDQAPGLFDHRRRKPQLPAPCPGQLGAALLVVPGAGLVDRVVRAAAPAGRRLRASRYGSAGRGSGTGGPARRTLRAGPRARPPQRRIRASGASGPCPILPQPAGACNSNPLARL